MADYRLQLVFELPPWGPLFLSGVSEKASYLSDAILAMHSKIEAVNEPVGCILPWFKMPKGDAGI
jgi:hypothetical protein